jgi:signal transduction histidine kinase
MERRGTVVGVTELADHGPRRIAGFGERHPRWVDVALVLALLAISLARHADWTAAAFDVALILPLLWRRRMPVGVFAVIAAVAFVQWLADVRAFGDAALLVALYAVAVSQPLRTTLAAAAVLEVGIVVAAARWSGELEPGIRAVVALSGMATAAGVLGTNARHRRQLVASLRERAERLERERDQEVQLAAVTERSRIARELHDIVAHNVSVMVALCDGAGYHVRDAPERAEAALATASRTGRQALAEMRRLLGVLRDAPGSTGRSPQPGVGQVDELVEQVRAAGVPVEYRLTGHAGRLPAGVQLAVYRIVQEALTNTLKHAGAGTSAVVSLSCDDDQVEVDVRDTGISATGPAGDGAGLRGMSERAAVYDGIVEAGPAPAGGWYVRTTLTVPATSVAGAPA